MEKEFDKGSLSRVLSLPNATNYPKTLIIKGTEDFHTKWKRRKSGTLSDSLKVENLDDKKARKEVEYDIKSSV